MKILQRLKQLLVSRWFLERCCLNFDVQRGMSRLVMAKRGLLLLSCNLLALILALKVERNPSYLGALRHEVLIRTPGEQNLAFIDS